MPTVVPVQTSKQLCDFIRAPYQVYKNDPLWVAPLEIERKEHFSTKYNPYFAHAKHQFFVAYDAKGIPLGRISAQIDNQEKNSSSTGHFGCLEATTPEVLQALLNAAEAWLRSHGIKEVTGPYSLSTNDELGLLIKDDAGTPPQILMNYAPSWYAAALEDANYSKVKDLLAYTFNLKDPLPKTVLRMAEKTSKRSNITERRLNMAELEEDLGLIMDIFNDAWANNWGFTPMTKAEIRHMAKNIKPLIDPDLARLMFIDGEPAAMIVALPNLNEALYGLKGKLFPFGWLKLLWRLKVKGLSQARVLLMGVRQQHQKGHLGGALATTLITHLHKIARVKGYKHTELSWILEDNAPMRNIIERLGATCIKTYRVYRKAL